ncbi:MAG: hypothetical protein KKD92_06245 [Proteobacteria bacterium]|nr:hypothetical protein [Pseudomonadota bacterium]
MSVFDLKYLIVVLISIDIILLAVCVFLILKIRLIPKTEVFERGIKLFESMLGDADEVSEQFQEQIRIKYSLIKKLSEQLDSRIDRLNILLNRVGILLSDNEAAPLSNPPAGSIIHRQNEILELAEKGCSVEEIADRLLISKGEIKLILDLNDKNNRTQDSRGVS